MSTAVATEARYTPDDLLSLPDGKSYELVHGQLVERNRGAESSRVGGRLYSRLDRYCDEHNLGIVWPADNGYQCFPHDPGLVRKPDVSFLRHGRLAGDIAQKGWVKIPPDLAVEVLSPNDRVYDLDEKLADYRKARIPLVWVINPESRTVTIHSTDRPITPPVRGRRTLGRGRRPRLPLHRTGDPAAASEARAGAIGAGRTDHILSKS